MSSGPQDSRTDTGAELTRELRQFHGLAATFFRAAAAHSGMTVTDMQVIDLLETSGPATAGQLADLTGLTTGAITGLLKRLEEVGRIRRERDPSDGRRVIVRLAPGKEAGGAITPLFASLRTAWDDLASHYDATQRSLLREFLQQNNALLRNQVVRLADAPSGEKGVFSAPLGNWESARLVVASPGDGLTLRTAAGMADLFQARFTGPAPDVKAKDGVVTIRYPRRLLALGGKQRSAEVALSVAIPWRIVIEGGGAVVVAELDGLDLSELEVRGGGGIIRLDLPLPNGVVPIRISGGGSVIVVRRPAGVAARANLKGWGSQLVFDDRTFSDMLESPGYDVAAERYDIEVSSSGSMVTVTEATPSTR